jgi:ADP-ribose pyrophosphatase YjhB (NUDIX family)
MLNRRIQHASFSSSAEPVGLLPFHDRPFNSVQIDIDELSSAVYTQDTADFSSYMFRTLSYLRDVKKTTAVWLTVPMAYSHFMPVAGLYGFKYHRAEGDVATLLLWLGDGESKVPAFATHHCGVAGIVKDGNKLLLVKERSKQNAWKFPGGYVNLGEDFGSAAVREVPFTCAMMYFSTELTRLRIHVSTNLSDQLATHSPPVLLFLPYAFQVFEETGIQTEFTSVLGFRHSHNIQFGRGDVYVFCLLKRASGTEIVQDDEIDAAEWMDICKFKEINRHPMHTEIISLLEAGNASIHLTEKTMESTIKGRLPFKIYTPKS